MSEPEQVPLREHLLSLIAANDLRYKERAEASEKAVNAALTAAKEAVQAALAASKEAVLKAEAAQEARNQGMNEFRGQLADQAQTFETRNESNLKLKALADRLDTLTTQVAALVSSRGGEAKGWGSAVSIAVFVAGLLAIASRFIK